MKFLTSLSILVSIAFASSAHAYRLTGFKPNDPRVLARTQRSAKVAYDRLQKEKAAKAAQDASEKAAKETGETLKYTGEL